MLRILLVRDRAGFHAERTTGAIFNRYLDCVFLVGILVLLEVPCIHVLERRRGIFQVFFVCYLGPDDCVWAGHHAFAALDTDVGIPLWNFQGDVPLLPLSGTAGPCSVFREDADRQIVPFASDEPGGDFLDELRRFRRNRWRHGDVAGNTTRHFDLVQVLQCCIHGLEVFLHDLLAPLAVGFPDCFLDPLDSLIERDDAADGEERRLHDGVDPDAQPDVFCDFVGVDDIELQFLVYDGLLDFTRQVIPDFVRPVWSVQEERCAFFGDVQNFVLLEEDELVHAYEIRFPDLVSAVDRPGAKAQVGDGLGPCLPGVVDEVSLGIERRLLADNLDGVLIGAHGAIRAESPEHSSGDIVRFDVERWIVVDAGEGYVVLDARGEVVLWAVFLHLIEDTFDHRGCEFLGGKPVPSTDDPRDFLERCKSVCHCLVDGGTHIHVERFSWSAGFLGAIQCGDHPGRGRERFHQVFGGERPVEPYFHHTDFLAFVHQVADGLVGCLRARAHEHDHTICVGSTHIVEQMVFSAHDLGKFVHHLLDDVGGSQIERIHRLAVLEVLIRVLGCAPDERVLWVHGPFPVGPDEIVVDHRPHVVVREHLDFVYLVGSAEAVHDVQERHTGFERACLGDEGEIVCFLNGCPEEHTPAGSSRCHDITVLAKDRQRVGCQLPGSDVEDCAGELACNLVEVGDHQEEALAGGKCSGEGSCLKCAMGCTCSSAFSLHLDYRGHRSPDIGDFLGAPKVCPFPHGG